MDLVTLDIDPNVCYHCTIERQSTMNLYIIVNGSYDDSSYFIVPGENMITALETFILYAQENDIDLDHPYALKPVKQNAITAVNWID